MTTIVPQRFDSKKVYTTPKGESRWASIVAPHTKFDAAGVYEIHLLLDADGEQEFLREMSALYESAYEDVLIEKHKRELPREAPPWHKIQDGRMDFKFKKKASFVINGEHKENPPPDLFDANGSRFKPDPDFYLANGSLVRVSFSVRPYFVQKAGITLRLKGVQVLRPIEYNTAKSHGFGQEDGWIYPAPKPDPQPPSQLSLPNADASEPVVITNDDVPW